MVLKTACWLLTHWHGWERCSWLRSTMVHVLGMEVFQWPLPWASEKASETAARHEP